LKRLAISAIYPTSGFSSAFIRSQVETLTQAGVDLDLPAKPVISVYQDVLENSSVVARNRRKNAAMEGAT
jgi:hypothetical protein